MTQPAPQHGAAPPEGRLLLACARAQAPTPEQAETVRRLAAASLDWPYLLRLAAAHRVQPLLYWHLKSAGAAVPDAAWQRLRQEFQFRSRRSLFMTAELLNVLRALEQHGVPALVYKGPVIAAGVYGNLALRSFDDLDVLVRPRDFRAATAALTGLGYHAGRPMSPAREWLFVASHGEVPYSNLERQTTVEIHVSVSPHYFATAFDHERIWSRAERVRLSGVAVPAIGAADLLVVLCAHGARHDWSRLTWVVDVAEIIRRQPHIDWAALLDETRRDGHRRMLCLGLLLAQRLAQAPLPPVAQAAIAADRVAQALAQQVEAQLFTLDRDETLLDRAMFHPFAFQARERWRDRARYLWRAMTMLSPEDWGQFDLPDRWWPLVTVLRPFRLAGKYTRRLFQRPAP